MSGHRLIEVTLYALKSELRNNEYFESCDTVNDFEIALEQLYENREDAEADVESLCAEAVKQGRTIDARIVKLRAIIEEVADGPTDFEL